MKYRKFHIVGTVSKSNKNNKVVETEAVKPYISNLVRMTRLHNNPHQTRSMPTYLHAKQFKRLREQNKDLYMIAKIGYSYLWKIEATYTYTRALTFKAVELNRQ